MDCRRAQEEILEFIDERRTNGDELDAHLAGCEQCRGLLETQSALDRKLDAVLSPPALSPAFRTSLRKKLRREPLSVWPVFLPDLAHWVGCFVATVLCIALLPFSSGVVMFTGLAVTLVTYFFQSVLQGSLEALEDEK